MECNMSHRAKAIAKYGSAIVRYGVCAAAYYGRCKARHGMLQPAQYGAEIGSTRLARVFRRMTRV